MRDLATGDFVDQYEITEVLARSGMATLFKALDRHSDRAVVLKVPHVQYECDVAFYERFRREEEIGHRLDHPNIVKVLSATEKSRTYLAMEYVEGRSLRAILRAGGPLRAEFALDVARQLGTALSYLHRHGVVHRDLKPENVLLVPPENTVKLLDFGIALLDSARRLTWAGLSGTLGTPDYMAPEQIRGRRGSARTDLYALGVILYEMLTGHLPHEAPSTAALLRAKLRRPPTPPKAYQKDLHPALQAIVLKALAREPQDRYGSAEEMLAHLVEPYASPASERPALESRRPPGCRWRRPLFRSLMVALLAAANASRAWRVHRHRAPHAAAMTPGRDAARP